MDSILMSYWVVGQVRTMVISVIYNSKVIMGNTILRRDLMITSDTFLRST